MERINLRKISDTLYQETNGNGKDLEDEKNSFYRKNATYFTDILDTIGISEYKKYLKKDHDDSKEYLFMQEDEEFLIRLLKEYTGENFKKLRRGFMNEVPDNFIIWIFEGIQNVFLHNSISDEAYQAVWVAMATRLEYPLRKAYGEILNIGAELDDTLRRAFEPKYKTYLTRNDNMAWLEALRNDFKSFIKWWSDIHDIMGDMRCEEINDMAEQEAINMPEEDIINAEVDFVISGLLMNALKHDDKYQQLITERENLLSKRTGFVKTQQTYFDSLVTQIRVRHSEIRERIIKENYPDISIPNSSEDNSDFSQLKKSIDVLREAIDYESEISTVKPQYMEISDIDLAAIEDRLKKLNI